MSQKHYVEVTFRQAGELFLFEYEGLELKKDQFVVVDTEHGHSLGTVKHLVETTLEAPPSFPLYPVLRIANDDDLRRVARHRDKEQEAFEYCRQKIQEYNMPMKLIQAEYFFNGSKLLFYFSAEGRIDFRTLVRDLARFFQKRIEMRQIGVRDSAKLMGGVGVCGQELCCSRFLRQFHPVSIRMVKDQSLPLNQQKVSGVCGRLMCCLAYEQGLYKDMRRQLPKIGQDVQTPKGIGKVREVQPLQQTVRVVFMEENPPVEEAFQLKDLPEFRDLPEVESSPVMFDQSKKAKRRRRRGLEPVMEPRRGQADHDMNRPASQHPASLFDQDEEMVDADLDEDVFSDEDSEELSDDFGETTLGNFAQDWTEPTLHEKPVSQILPQFANQKAPQARKRPPRQTSDHQQHPAHSQSRTPDPNRNKAPSHPKRENNPNQRRKGGAESETPLDTQSSVPHPHRPDRRERPPQSARSEQPTHRGDRQHRRDNRPPRTGGEQQSQTSVQPPSSHPAMVGRLSQDITQRTTTTTSGFAEQTRPSMSGTSDLAKHDQMDGRGEIIEPMMHVEEEMEQVSEDSTELQGLRQGKRRRRPRRRSSGHRQESSPGDQQNPVSPQQRVPSSGEIKPPDISQDTSLVRDSSPQASRPSPPQEMASAEQEHDPEKRKRRRRRRKKKRSTQDLHQPEESSSDDHDDDDE